MFYPKHKHLVCIVLILLSKYDNKNELIDETKLAKRGEK